MDADRPSDELLRRMLAAVVGAFGADEGVDRLIESARVDAEAEVRDLLKSAVKATLLQRAVSRLESWSPDSTSAETVSVPSEDDADDAPPVVPHEPPQDPSRTACYVYGIIKAGRDALPAGLAGVDPRSPPRWVRHGEVQALTSDISLDELGPEGLAERVKDLVWVEEKVRAHDGVVKHLLGAGAVVPCRFCTVLRSADDVRAVLARHERDLSATLDALEGKTEWGVKVLAAPRGGAAGGYEAVADKGDPGAKGRGGKAYFLEKKRGELARAEAGRAVREAVDECHRELSAAAAAATLLSTNDRGIGRGGPAEVVMNGAYLVEDLEAERFHALAAALAGRHAARGLSLEVTGPWPPYNFVSLDLSLGEDAVEGANPSSQDDQPAEVEPEAAA